MLESFPGPAKGLVKGIMKLIVLGVMFLYVVSPIDLLPEAVLGPIGLIDDLAVVVFGASFLGFDLFKGLKQKRATFQGGKNE